MDLSYLLFLQDFRHTSQDFFTPFLEGVSFFSLAYLLLIPVFIYWCVSKRGGLYILASFAVGIAVNSCLKLTFCTYRPWMRNPLIIPAGSSIHTASGYSFPSGHCIFASALYGGIAVTCWKRARWVSVLCIIGMLLTGFSRNYLGVHTPQDVIVGLGLGVLVLWGMHRLFTYLSAHPQQENKWLLGGFVLSCLMLLWITCKPYPLDYVDGKLLADPQRMVVGGYREIGMLLAFCAARYVEKRWVRFTETGLNAKGILWGLAGLLPLLWCQPKNA